MNIESINETLKNYFRDNFYIIKAITVLLVISVVAGIIEWDTKRKNKNDKK